MIADAPPPGYRLKASPDGVGEEVIPRAHPGSALLALFGAAWAAIGVGGMLDRPSWRMGEITPLILLVVCVGFGCLLLFGQLKDLLLAEDLLYRDGTLARRWRVRPFGPSLIQGFPDLVAVQIAHRIWKTGSGSTDQLFLLLPQRRVPISRSIVNQRHRAWTGMYLSRIGEPSPVRPSAVRMLQPGRVIEDEVPSAILFLGRFLSGRTGVPLRVSEELVSEPNWD